MTNKPTCSSGLLARIVALEAVIAALKELLNERDHRYEERSIAQDRAVGVAMDSSKAAITKAEMATEKRLEGLNELRSMAEDQSRNFARNDEMKLVHTGFDKRIDELTSLVRQQMAHGGGIKDAIGYVAGAAGLLIAAIAAYVTHK